MNYNKVNSDRLVEDWKKYLEELVDPKSIDVSSFELKNNLQSGVWNSEKILDPEVGDLLYDIAKDFFDSLELDWVEIADIIFTGSLAAYNWSRFSDIDLHILIDFKDVDENQELVKEYLKSERLRWNRTHKIHIKGFEVEIYIQDVSEEHHAAGVYSIIKDHWLIVPTREDFEVDWATVQKKAASLMDRVEDVYKLFEGGEYEEAETAATRLKEKIRKFRQAGLDKGGIYSAENLAFKALRRNGSLERLSSLRVMSYDKKMSMDEQTKNTEKEHQSNEN